MEKQDREIATYDGEPFEKRLIEVGSPPPSRRLLFDPALVGPQDDGAQVFPTEPKSQRSKWWAWVLVLLLVALALILWQKPDVFDLGLQMPPVDTQTLSGAGFLSIDAGLGSVIWYGA